MLYYLHGYFDSEDRTASVRALVFGERSFNEAYGESLLHSLLLNVFTYETVLFVGVDPTEPHLASVLQQGMRIRKQISSTRRSSNIPKRFMLCATSDDMSRQEQVLLESSIREIQSLDIRPVLYDRRESDYRGLEEVLFAWVEKGDFKNQPPPFATGFDLDPDVEAGEA